MEFLKGLMEGVDFEGREKVTGNSGRRDMERMRGEREEKIEEYGENEKRKVGGSERRNGRVD